MATAIPIDLLVRVAGDADVPAIMRLRAAWTGTPADESYVRAFDSWWARERDQRVTWLAELDGRPMGMLNMLVFTRMPRPGREQSRWGYVANVFVLAEHRNAQVGERLLDAAKAHADEHGFARLVLSPSDRSVPFYERAGFSKDNPLMVRPC